MCAVSPPSSGPLAPAEVLLQALERHALVLRLDRRGRILESNASLCELAGWGSSELLGTSYHRLCGGPLPRTLHEAIRAGLRAEGSWRGPLPLVTSSGSHRWLDMVLTRLPGELLAFGADATQAHRQSEELAKLGRLYEALSRVGQLLGRGATRKSLFEGVCEALVALAGFKMVWIGLDNPATHEVAVVAQFGDTEGYLQHIKVRSDDTLEGRGPGGLAIRLGRPCVLNDFLHDAESKPWHEAARRAGLAANATFPIFQGGRSIGHLSLYSGEPNFFGTAEVGLMEKVANQLSFALDHLEEQAERARAEERFATIFDASPAATSLARISDGTYVVVNAAFERILGYAAEEVIGHTADELGLWTEPDKRARYLESLKRQPGGAQEWETTLRTRSGQEIRALYTGEVLAIQGEMYILSLFLDVTRSHQVEAERDRLRTELYQSQKMEAIGLLAGGVAHDLNNVLGAILAHAEIMERKLPADSPLIHHVQQTVKAVERSHGIVHQLLAFSRKLPTAPILLDLNDQISQFLRTLAPLLGEQIHIQWSPQPELPKVTFDPNLLDQVVMNLLVNARDAMPKGGRIALATRAVSAQESATITALKGRERLHVCLTCRDTGLGMEEATKARIFEPFFTTKPLNKGTGLGLSTVFGIVEQAGGAIEVESEPGLGAEFRIYLPAELGALPLAAQAECAPGFSRSLRILLVEDSEILRNALAEGLRMHGQQVLALESPLQALEHFTREKGGFDVLITDVVMPELSGLDLLDKIRALQPGQKAILISGYAPDDLEERLRVDSGLHFLRKPFSSPALLSLLKKVADPPT
ncbi:MAG TPA: PAS domain S-box protein [Holophagaceae bacterium]|nr:PAS domain S-box protein [Holophagaceae bacterium]